MWTTIDGKKERTPKMKGAAKKAKLGKGKAQKKGAGKGGKTVSKKVKKTNLKNQKSPQEMELAAKMREKLSKIDDSLKVWVGGVPEDVKWQTLRDVFKTEIVID